VVALIEHQVIEGHHIAFVALKLLGHRREKHAAANFMSSIEASTMVIERNKKSGPQPEWPRGSLRWCEVSLAKRWRSGRVSEIKR
jgi:hypothetical protein